MKKEEFKKILIALEKECLSESKNFKIAEKINSLLKLYKDQLSVDQIKHLKWEFLLFSLMTKNRFDYHGLVTERFAPMVTYTNGNIFPDPDSFPLEVADYFHVRAKTSQNPIFKARYFDFLWEKSNFKKKHLFAIAAIEEHLASVDIYKEEDDIIAKLDALQRATELSLRLEGRTENKSLSKLVARKLYQQIDIAVQSKKYRWLLEMLEVAIALKSQFKKEDFKKFIAICDEAAESYRKENNFHLERSFLELKKQIIAALGSGSTDETNNQIGDSLVKEARSKTESGIARVLVLKNAIEFYKKLGNREKVEELIGEIKEASRQAIDGKEFKMIEIPYNIKKDDIKKMKDGLGTHGEIFENLIFSRVFFPNWSRAVQQTEKHDKTSISHLFGSSTHFGIEYPIGVQTTEEELKEDRVMRNFQLEINLNLNLLSRFFHEFIRDGELTYEDFEKHITKIKLIDDNTYETILEGIKDFFNGDHFRTIVILAPQLEDLLRGILRISGRQTTTIRENAFGEKTLGAILDELRPILSDSLYYYLQWILRDYRGFNIRNRTAHGSFKKNSVSPLFSVSLIHVVCILAANITTKEIDRGK